MGEGKTAGPLDAGNALDTLVHQFADPLAFLRELVQNAVDAGSREVEVRFEFAEPSGDTEGTMIIHIDDWGEGMDRQIIDSQLTRLFSSSKEGDFTKIGKFGIGFVSVFALEPDAVCLDTSRGGENWRVLFKRDRSFVRIARDEPVEGTKVQVIKAVLPGRYAELKARALTVLRYWCKHLPAEVRFDGRAINEPLGLDLPCTARHAEQDTEVVAGYTPDGSRFAGFYNKGLTLLEEQAGPFPGVSFKISSRYLEHTLTRDNVIRDVHFEKAMAIVRRLVEGPLPARLLERLEEEVERDPASPAADGLFHLAATHLPSRRGVLQAGAQRKLFTAIDGRPVTLGEAREAARQKRLERTVRDSAVGRALAASGRLVVVARGSSAEVDALAALTGSSSGSTADARLCLPRPLEPGERTPGGETLCAALFALLRARKARLAGVFLARFDGPGSWIADRVAITQREPGELTALEDVRELATSIFSRRRHLALNVGHSAVARLVVLAPREPELAAYLAAKLFYLGDRLDAVTDGALALRAMEARCRRQTA
jgi:molecular chaperone HtpG